MERLVVALTLVIPQSKPIQLIQSPHQQQGPNLLMGKVSISLLKKKKHFMKDHSALCIQGRFC